MNVQLMAARSGGADWKRLAEQFDGNLYHSQEWAETCRTDHSIPVFFRGLDEDGRCIGIALGIETRSRKPIVGRFLKRLDFETCPAVEGNDAGSARAMVAKLAEYGRTGGYRSLSMHSFCSNVAIPDFGDLGFKEIPRIEFRVDLTASEEDLWRGLSSHHQRKIKKARRHGLVFEESSTVEAMQDLRRLQIGSRDRRVERGEYFGLQDEGYYERLGREYFGRNLARLCFMSYEGRRVSAAFVSIYAGRALYVLGGSDPKGFELDAPALLFWHLFTLCRDLGCTEFNLGGVPASAVDSQSLAHGLYRFKSGFGSRAVLCRSGIAESLRTGVAPILLAAKHTIGL